ncbi:MAG: DUF4159 domain-containing protein [Planctomycetes bacterium]|nr:DUF4159 domain-containing protein [Planctomycetota bacterium]
MTARRVFLAATFVLLALTSTVAAATDEEIQAAIDRGAQYLLSIQQANGWFTPTAEVRWVPAGAAPLVGTQEAMALLGLAYADVDVRRDEVRRGIEALLQFDMQHVYSVGARIMALSKYYRKMDRELRERVRPVIKNDLVWLVEAQGGEGQWTYGSLGGGGNLDRGWDFSNVQMAVLAFQEAGFAGFEYPEDTMRKAMQLYLSRQNDDGGWNYGSRQGFQASGNAADSYGSMTAAAVASLYITRDALFRGSGCPCSGGRSGERPKALDRAIDRGIDWLGKNFEVTRNPRGVPQRWILYWLYSCERVGLSAGLKYFGTHNWYGEGADFLVRRQGGNGNWILGGEGPSDTTYAICFLAKGRAPILMNKLQFEGDWDRHPRDLANLAHFTGDLKEQLIRWQVINLIAPVEEWHDSPILYISAESEIPLTDEHKAKLRRFTDTGGTILFEASCGNRTVDGWWRKTVAEIWPEWEFKSLSREHPVYSSDQEISQNLPRFETLDDGVRTFLWYTRFDISCPWNTMATTNRAAMFLFGINLYAYATDKRPLRSSLAGVRRDASQRAAASIRGGSRDELTLARVKHGGDYYVGRNYGGPALFSQTLSAKGGPSLILADEVEPADLKPEQVAWVTGRQGVAMTADKMAALVRYLDGGGFLLAEAILGDERFDKAFRELAKQAGIEVKALAADDAVLTGQFSGASGYAIDKVGFKRSLLAERIGNAKAELYGLYRGGKMVGVYSPLDLMYSQTGLDAWGSRGYEADDARTILANILLRASAR